VIERGSGVAIGVGSGLAIGANCGVAIARGSGPGVSSGAASGVNSAIAIDGGCRVAAALPAIFSYAEPGGNVTSIPLSVGGFSNWAIGCNDTVGCADTAPVMCSTSLRFMMDLKSVGGGGGLARGEAPDKNGGRLGKSESSTSIKISITTEPPTIAAIALVTSNFFNP
jgi:hypothetical protein